MPWKGTAIGIFFAVKDPAEISLELGLISKTHRDCGNVSGYALLEYLLEDSL